MSSTINISFDGPHNQMIDFNKSFVNFQSTIVLSPSDDKSEYKIGIITQEDLDAGNNPILETVVGSQTINYKVQDNTTLQTYYLVLSGVQDKKVEVNISITELPGHTIDKHLDGENNYNMYMKITASVAILLIGGGLIYYFTRPKKEEPKFY